VRDAHVHEFLLENSSNAARKKANNLAQLEIDLNSIVYKMWAHGDPLESNSHGSTNEVHT
jgi:hypothetical protein